MSNNQSLPDGLILSAGFSSRMKRFKPLIMLQDKPLLLHIIKKMSTSCNTITVVTGFRHDEIVSVITPLLKPELQTRVQFVYNASYADGMYGSLKTGFRALQESEWVLFHFVDQPGIPAPFYKEFVSQIERSYNWIQPRCEGRNAHPILIHNSLFTLIYEQNEFQSLRDISRLPVVKKKLWECCYPGVLMDIDTEEDWEKFITSQTSDATP
jgi:molybdenum cofactor cytidylyltransferase